MSTLTGGAPWVDETPKRHKNDHRTGRCGGIGRRDGFKIRSGSPRVWVRVPPPALLRGGSPCLVSIRNGSNIKGLSASVCPIFCARAAVLSLRRASPDFAPVVVVGRFRRSRRPSVSTLAAFMGAMGFAGVRLVPSAVPRQIGSNPPSKRFMNG